jgi:hypothetical protein
MAMVQSVRVSLDNIEVVKDGDPSGQGDLYWYFRADGIKIADRGVSSPRKTASGEHIPIGKSVTVVKNPGETLVLYGAISDKDSGTDLVRHIPQIRTVLLVGFRIASASDDPHHVRPRRPRFSAPAYRQAMPLRWDAQAQVTDMLVKLRGESAITN